MDFIHECPSRGLTQEQNEEVGDGEGEQVVVGGGAHAGEAQDDAAHREVAENARDRHHCIDDDDGDQRDNYQVC